MKRTASNLFNNQQFMGGIGLPVTLAAPLYGVIEQFPPAFCFSEKADSAPETILFGRQKTTGQ